MGGVAAEMGLERDEDGHKSTSIESGCIRVIMGKKYKEGTMVLAEIFLRLRFPLLHESTSHFCGDERSGPAPKG